MYLLYHHPLSQHARRVTALFHEAGLDHQTLHVAMEEGAHTQPAYLAINPNHQIPALVDDGLTIFESNAILRYLCNKHGLDEWYSPDPRQRAVIDQWLDWNQCRLSPAVVDIVLNRVFLGEDGDRDAISNGLNSLRELEPILEAALRSQNYLGGTRATIADLSVASNLNQLRLADLAPAAPATADWLSRVNALPGMSQSNSQLEAALAA